MIRKLKRKFILLATISVFLLLAILVGIMNLINYSAVVSDAQTILRMLSENEQPHGERPPEPPDFRLPPGMSPEVPYESRYFSVTVSTDGEILRTDTSRIIAVDRESAADYVRKAMQNRKDTGFADRFLFKKQTRGQIVRILFLDCGRKLDDFYRFLYISCGMALLGVLLVFLIFVFAADRILRPIAESYEKQKRFITDAGHEIRTPLSIIQANAQLLESETEDKESLRDIQQQTERLTELTRDLIFLAKMDEAENPFPQSDFSVSDLLTEAAESFAHFAQTQSKTLKSEIQPGLSMHGIPEAIQRLFSVLLDNALKYSPTGSEIRLNAEAHGQSLHIRVSNPTAEPVTAQTLSRVFDRFYRPDTSRSTEAGGHGIGMSIAKAAVEAHGGKITVHTSNGRDFCVEVTLPVLYK